MSHTRRFFAFLLAPLGVVATFFVHGVMAGPSQEVQRDPWLAVTTTVIMLVIGWTAELLLALPLLYMAVRAGWTTWLANLTIGAGVGAIVAILLLKIWHHDERAAALFITGCTIGGIASAALHRLIAPEPDGEADDYRAA